MFRISLCVAGTLACASAHAMPAPASIQLVLSALHAQSYDASGAPSGFIGITHTGTIDFTTGSASSFDDVLLSGVPQGVASGQLASFAGSVQLGNGTILGGSVMLMLNNGDSFNATIASGVGQVILQPGQVYAIDGLFSGATFSTNTFGGVNVTPFFNAQPISGAFLFEQLNPLFVFNGEGFDDSVDLSITLVPSAPAAATLGLGFVGCVSRRRRD